MEKDFLGLNRYVKNTNKLLKFHISFIIIIIIFFFLINEKASNSAKRSDKFFINDERAFLVLKPTNPYIIRPHSR